MLTGRSAPGWRSVAARLGLGDALVPLPYRLLYWLHVTPWDRGAVPAQLKILVEGDSALQAGRALDLGCGTGVQSRYLAEHGWAVTGIDNVPRAVARADARSAGMTRPPRWILGDVAVLDATAVTEKFSLILDIGCLFGLSHAHRVATIRGLDAIAEPGARLLRFGLTEREDDEHTYRHRWRRVWTHRDRRGDPPGPNGGPRWTCWARVDASAHGIAADVSLAPGRWSRNADPVGAAGNLPNRGPHS